jgi:transcriptional regulator with XRE-family HTH domain/mannose-6-phosphate isomerase-like protein (cupin superfamily)
MTTPIANPPIGERLREIRGQHEYSIRGLALKAGLSASLVSDIEKGKVEPSISTLTRLASVMGVTITYFFAPRTVETGRVIRAADRVPFTSATEPRPGGPPPSGAHLGLITPTGLEALSAVWGHFDPGAQVGDEPYVHEGEDWGVVVAGRLKVVVGDAIYFLDAGDSIWFHGTIPHRLENVSNDVTEYIWVNIPAGR